ncbi:MAG: permease [Candidatus Dormibacteria bacterium]
MSAVAGAVLASLRMSALMFWDTLWPLIFGFGLSGAVQAFAPRERMRSMLGDHRPASLLRAGVLGAVSSSCSYAASAMARSLVSRGADFTTAMVFMVASTNLVIELGLVIWILLGWQFAAAEYVGGVVMIVLLAVLSRFFLSPSLLEGIRRRLARAEPVTGHGGSEAPAGWKRLRSREGWVAAAGYTIADLNMLRRELVIGYLVAGALAVLVPDSLWGVVFLRGHGAWTSVENALVGPLIAVVSFVCSIGNIPLAASLWKGGISFGGVISFIFADLIAMPLILIYRRLYGGAPALRLVALLWVAMSLAGLITQALFGWAGLVPAVRPVQVVDPAFHLNYTTWLNLAFVALFVVIVRLHRSRDRYGADGGYALDPVCGMQVERAHAPAQAEWRGGTVHFCSDHCCDRFLAAPERYSGAGSAPEAGRSSV